MMHQSGPLLITGASGFVGANLCRFFSALRIPVIALEGPGDSHWRLDGAQGLKRVAMDLSHEMEVRKFLRAEKPSVILNLAAYGAYSSQTDAKRIYQVNFDALRTLLEGAHEIPGFKAFVQAGSSSEYGLNCKAPSEESATVPDSDYAVSKVAASALIQYYGKKHGLPAWSFRLYSVYGPYEEISRLIPNLLVHAQDKKLPPLVGPKISRDFVFTEDVCQAFRALLEKSATLPRGEIYNIGSGQCVTLEKLVATARRSFGITAEPVWGSMPERRWDHPDWYGDPSKAMRDFGWKSTISLEDGLKRTAEWMSQNPKTLEAARLHSVVRPPGGGK